MLTWGIRYQNGFIFSMTLGLFLFFLNFKSSKRYVILLHDVFSSNNQWCFSNDRWFIVPIVVCHFPLPKALYPIRSWQCVNVYESRPCNTIFVLEKKVIVPRQEKLEGSTIELVSHCKPTLQNALSEKKSLLHAPQKHNMNEATMTSASAICHRS